MKKLLTLILLAFVFVSCSKDDDNTDDTFIDKELINVQWKLTDGSSALWIFNDSQMIMYAIRSERDKTIAKVLNGTFDYRITTDGRLLMNGKTLRYVITGDKLSITGDGPERVFKRVEGYTIVE